MTYWFVKTLVAQVMEKAKEDQQEILHTLRILKVNLNLSATRCLESGSLSIR